MPRRPGRKNPANTGDVPSLRRFSVYGREAAAYVQSPGLKAVAVVCLRLLNSRLPEQDISGGLFLWGHTKKEF